MILPILAIGVLAIIIYFVVLPYSKCLAIRRLLGSNNRMVFFPLGGYIAKSLVSYGKTRDLLDYLPKGKKPEERFLISNLLLSPYVILEEPELAKQYLLNHTRFHKQSLALFSEHYFSKSIAISQGETWNRQKRLFSKALNFDFLAHLVPKIQATCQRHYLQVALNVPMSVYITPFNIAAEVICQTFFSRNMNNVKVRGVGLVQKLRQCLKFCIDSTPTVPFLIRVLILGKDSTKWGAFLTAKQKIVLEDFKTIQSIISSQIDVRAQALKLHPEQAIDFLDHYTLEYISEKNQQQKLIDKEEIVQQFITLFTAGSDTTSTLVGMCLYNLAKYPDSFSKLEDLIRELPEALTIQDINSMQALTNFIKQTARMYPPTFDLFPRYNKEEIQLGGYKFPPNTYFGIGIKTIMNDPHNFPEPDTFKPERWSEQSAKLMNHYTYLTFSAGPRSCVGQRLAIMEIKIMLIEFIRLFTVKQNREVTFQMKIDSVYKLAHEFMIIPTRREQLLKR